MGVVFYHEWASPLLDPTPMAAAALESYAAIPRMLGRPEPVLGIAEAWEMVEDYSGVLENPVVILAWTAVARPRTPLDVGLSFLRRAGIEHHVLVSKGSLPGWARHAGVDEAQVTLYRPQTNPARLLARLLHGRP